MKCIIVLSLPTSMMNKMINLAHSLELAICKACF